MPDRAYSTPAPPTPPQCARSNRESRRNTDRPEHSRSPPSRSLQMHPYSRTACAPPSVPTRAASHPSRSSGTRPDAESTTCASLRKPPAPSPATTPAAPAPPHPPAPPHRLLNGPLVNSLHREPRSLQNPVPPAKGWASPTAAQTSAGTPLRRCRPNARESDPPQSATRPLRQPQQNKSWRHTEFCWRTAWLQSLRGEDGLNPVPPKIAAPPKTTTKLTPPHRRGIRL